MSKSLAYRTKLLYKDLTPNLTLLRPLINEEYTLLNPSTHSLRFKHNTNVNKESSSILIEAFTNLGSSLRTFKVLN